MEVGREAQERNLDQDEMWEACDIGSDDVKRFTSGILLKQALLLPDFSRGVEKTTSRRPLQVSSAAPAPDA